MAYVIGNACIGTKDTACIDACPTDSIHGYTESPQLYIDPATCIDCDACAQACPVNAIYPGDQVPAAEKKFVEVNSSFYLTWDRSKSIVELKKKSSKPAVTQGEATAVEEDENPTWTLAQNWERAWEENKNNPEDLNERQKRYGRVRTVYENKGSYVIRFYLPEKTPNHMLVYKYNLPKEIKKYDVEAKVLDENHVRITGQLKDAKLIKLSGLVNSFPDRFVADLPLNEAIESASIKVQNPYTVDVIIAKKQKVA